MRKKLVIFVVCLFSGISFSEAQVLPKDSLYTEFKYFIKLLEETHPDPYTEFGGKIQFHKKAFDIGQQIKNNDFTLEQYNNKLLSFLSNIHDGHTYVFPKAYEGKIQKKVPVSFRTIADGLIINGLPSQYKEYIGARVKAINGTPIDSLCMLISGIMPSENIYGEYNAIEKAFNDPVKLYSLFPKMEDEFYLSVITSDNQNNDLILRLSENAIIDKVEAPKWNRASDRGLCYKYVDDKKQSMYLKIETVMFREAFLYMTENNWSNIDDMLDNVYKKVFHEKRPKDRQEAINKIPHLSETFRKMLETMEKNKSSNLIIDLRNNSGGFTNITFPGLYMLYGDKYLNTDMDNISYRLVSPLLMNKLGTTLDEYNKSKGKDYRFGDYSFPSSEKVAKTIEQKRNDLIKNAMGGADRYINDLYGKPLYAPQNIYVITNAGTFSAAFHYAFYLWKMGATVVGVPSSQAPNTFMEGTPFELPYTKTKGSISNSAQYFLPAGDKRAKIFWPDLMPEYNDYKKYNFDQDAELLWLLDYIKNK